MGEEHECGEFEVIAETSAALLLAGDCVGEVWIPRSQISEDSELASDAGVGDEGVLLLPEWLAVEKGLA